MIFVFGVLVCWRSKNQQAVARSSAESEWYALAEAVKEVPFLIQLLMFMEVKIKPTTWEQYTWQNPTLPQQGPGIWTLEQDMSTHYKRWASLRSSFALQK